MGGWRKALAIGLLAFVAGCSVAGCSDSGGGSDGTAGETPTASSAPQPEATTEPPVEPTEPEQPQSRQPNRPAINNAKLPIGGSPELGANGRGCVNPVWGSGELPAGVTITARRFEVSGDDVIEFFQAACDGQQPACGPGSLFSGDAPACYLGVRKTGSGVATVNVFGDITCPSEAVCEEVRKNFLGAGSSLTFDTTGGGEPPPTEETPTETPTDTPSDG